MKGTRFQRRRIDRRVWSVGLLLFLTIFFLSETPALAKVYFNVGILSRPKSLNPFQTTDAWTKRVLMLLHQPLYLVEPDTLTLVPWLAADQPVYDPSTKTLTFHLREMRWDDGAEFSAEDVVFTAKTIKRFRVPKYFAYWEFVKKIEAPDKRTVRITTGTPTPILYTWTLTTRIVQRRKWEPIIEEAEKELNERLDSERAKGEVGEEALKAALKEPLKMIQTHVVTRPTGLGPFRLKEWKGGNYILLVRNDHYFGQGKTIAGRQLGPFIDGVVFKIYDTLGPATLALKKGEIDFLWKGVSHALMGDLTRGPGIRLERNLDSGYRYLAFNLRKAPMSDPAFRIAVAYLIDKDFIIRRILHNHGERLDTVVPPGISFFFNEKTPAYGKGMDRENRIREAYRILTASGYRWKKPPLDDRGTLRRGAGLTTPDGIPVPSLTILTPPTDYDTELASAAQVIQQWLRHFGIPITRKTMPFARMIQEIRNERDFDMFVLGWRGLYDPDYLRRFFHSSFKDRKGRNYAGYSNAEFDEMADLQALTMDPLARQRIVLDLQSLLMRDLPYIPLYVPARLEGVRTDRFEGWTKSLGGVGNHWTFCLLRPIGE
jgi:ABC-type transport system substrate-binding protein